jgi:hypothetical protein
MFESINHSTALAGAVYPFLHRLQRDWEITSIPAEELSGDEPTPTLRWVNGSAVKDLHIADMNHAAFASQTGLTFHLNKGGFVLSKRISRIMRPYWISGFFPAEAVHIQYLSQRQREAKIWDGAGLVSRAMLRRLIAQLPVGLSAAKRREMTHELEHAQRVEFTIMTAKGQDKGHAIVTEREDFDFCLPEDTKNQVTLNDGSTWIGIYPVHGASTMRIDIQSLINLYPFFKPEQLLTWLEEEGEHFTEAIRSNGIADIMGHISQNDSIDDLVKWHVREYFASGGHALWFSGIVKTLMNQRITQISTATTKLRLPIHGARYYVMCTGVGQAAGRDLQVEPGQIQVDPDAHTVWVNDDDWCQLHDSRSGIAGILGGADQDDALWLHPFTDHNGQQQILGWRSPNQPGEYVILTPNAASAAIRWPYEADAPAWPHNDSGLLTARIDQKEVNYLNLINPATAGGLGEGQDYTPAVMDATIERGKANASALGTVCNLLMLAQAVWQRLPAHPPAPLEQVIDASVKTGEDLSAVMDWCQTASEKIVQSNTPIPAILIPRLGNTETHPLQATTDHWLDTIVNGVSDHLDRFDTTKMELAATTMPPIQVFDQGWTHIQQGIGLNQLYNRSVSEALRRANDIDGVDFEAVQAKCEAYLDQFEAEEHLYIVLGAITSNYLRDEHTSDAAIWQRGAKQQDGSFLPGIANLTLEALRRIDLLQHVDLTAAGLIAYPAATVIAAPAETIQINGVWMNYLRTIYQAHGQALPDEMNAIQKEQREWAKQRIALLAAGQFGNMELTIRDEDDRKVAYTPSGNLFGYVSKNSAERITGSTLTLKRSLAVDGNILALIA